ncbi:formylglycine-generating enzyme family protein [Nostoc sp. FACHB-87]|uniref:formylglycine-generating enzyme family protein n=1 Tax=Nostocaceae TaxID=1162 RepID=UPI0016881528|nr:MULTISPECIES: formylglycine-generating enzyme family protein [Nostocaceae]MBD2458491.1 formylglycine-generating enzyme family protein [Nostoc sp. FACHB-87]MBD2478641.1 formylglycine-generating enzyme family protein [Anabaena sp. FACHB-83]
MTDLTDTAQLRELAKQAVDRFVRRFEESYRLLAYHAALPLVLTPELVNYLRNEFLRGEQVPWVAEVDLLLSDLCSQVGYELYAMDTHVREYLLEEMKQDLRFGKRRMQQVAQVLYSYVSYLHRLNPGRRQKEIEAQRWAAMVYLGDEQCKQAVQEIAQKLIETSSSTDSKVGSESGIRAELLRLARITEELSPQLEQEPNLLDYARLVQRILRTPELVTSDELNRSYQIDDEELTFPQKLLPQVLAEAVQSSRPKVVNIKGFPQLKTFKFEVAVISFEEEIVLELQSFDFKVATITGIKQSNISNTNRTIAIANNLVFLQTKKNLNHIEQLIIQATISNQSYDQIAESYNYNTSYISNVASKLWKVLSEVLGEKVNKINFKNVIQSQVNYSQLDIHHSRRQAQCFIEDLGNNVQLEMVAIPEGSFLMGSSAGEPERYDDESPQYQVAVPAFFMGKYPITQAQWKAVAGFPQVNKELDPDPSSFKGANRPVERVSWYDAVEFCSRLSQYTGKSYCLPSEAEWEYSCRAGTTTPFHFGETITSELANYDATKAYGAGVEGTYRKQTTSVGSFKVANAFGLYDIHGNVWEWCLDDWHDNYEGAPEDGSAWFKNDNDNLYQKQGRAVLRGGSWNDSPGNCRSASRYSNAWAGRGLIDLDVGFRVVCGVGGILR